MRTQAWRYERFLKRLCTTFTFLTLTLMQINFLSAQDSPVDPPWWLGINLGYGQVNLTSDQAHYGNQGAFALAFHGGRKLGTHFRVGAELGAWSLEATNQSNSFDWEESDLRNAPWEKSGLTHLSGVIDFLPVPSLPVYARVGAGWASHWSNRLFESGSSGWSWKAGGGCSIRVGDRFTLTPAFNYSQGYLGDIRNSALTETGRRYSVWDVTIGLSMHFGEPR